MAYKGFQSHHSMSLDLLTNFILADFVSAYLGLTFSVLILWFFDGFEFVSHFRPYLRLSIMQLVDSNGFFVNILDANKDLNSKS